MEKPKQKFIVGELVGAVVPHAPQWNVEKAEILVAEYGIFTDAFFGVQALAWNYLLSSEPSGPYYREDSLKKLPPGDDVRKFLKSLKKEPVCG